MSNTDAQLAAALALLEGARSRYRKTTMAIRSLPTKRDIREVKEEIRKYKLAFDTVMRQHPDARVVIAYRDAACKFYEWLFEMRDAGQNPASTPELKNKCTELYEAYKTAKTAYIEAGYMPVDEELIGLSMIEPVEALPLPPLLLDFLLTKASAQDAA